MIERAGGIPAMTLFTIGFTRKSAGEFFGALRKAGVRHLIDTRVRNRSQLAGFAKRDDLVFFLDALVGATYEHRLELAPTEALLADYRSGRVDWQGYAALFRQLLTDRDARGEITPPDLGRPTVLLCSESGADRCHRRLVAEHLATTSRVQIVHL